MSCTLSSAPSAPSSVHTLLDGVRNAGTSMLCMTSTSWCRPDEEGEKNGVTDTFYALWFTWQLCECSEDITRAGGMEGAEDEDMCVCVSDWRRDWGCWEPAHQCCAQRVRAGAALLWFAWRSCKRGEDIACGEGGMVLRSRLT
jgi:hypothetical protein